MGCCFGNIPTVSYLEVKDLPNHPDVLLIDVREPREIQRSSAIPTSINIPLKRVKKELALQGDADEFERKYGRNKPTVDAEIIFSCRSGGRAESAAKTAINMGYTNVKTYKGSWDDWDHHEAALQQMQKLLVVEN